MFALLECVCESTLSHQTASIKPVQNCGPYMPMTVLIRARPGATQFAVIKAFSDLEQIGVITSPKYTVTRKKFLVIPSPIGIL